MYAALLLALLAAPSLAAPHPQARKSTGYTVPVHSTPRRRAVDGPHRRAVDDVEVISWGHDYTYAIPISVGTPPQSMQVIIDTGSADTWFRSACDTTNCVNAPLYDPSKSTTSVNATANPQFNAGYGVGMATGYKVADKVTLGDYWVQGSFGAATFANTSHTADSQIAGLMGFALPGALQNKGLDLLWQRFVAGGEQTFSLYLPRDTVTDLNWDLASKVGGGALTLGGIDSQYYTGDINYLKVVAAKDSPSNLAYWVVELDNMTINGKILTTDGAGGKARALIDSGTSSNAVPREVAEAVYSFIPGAVETPANSGMWNFPCDSLNSTEQRVSFTFGGVEYDMQKWDLASTRDYDMTQCRGSFYVLADTSRFDMILGASFMKNVYTIHRVEPFTLGFAKLADQFNKPLYGGQTTPTTNSTNNSTSSASTSATNGATPTSVNPLLKPTEGGNGPIPTLTKIEDQPSQDVPIFNPSATQGGGAVEGGASNNNKPGNNGNGASGVHVGSGVATLVGLGAGALISLLL